MYAGNLALGSAIAYAVHPEPLMSRVGILVVALALIGTYAVRSLIERYMPTLSNKTLLQEWVSDVELPARRVKDWKGLFNPEEEFDQATAKYRMELLEAQRIGMYGAFSIITLDTIHCCWFRVLGCYISSVYADVVSSRRSRRRCDSSWDVVIPSLKIDRGSPSVCFCQCRMFFSWPTTRRVAPPPQRHVPPAPRRQ